MFIAALSVIAPNQTGYYPDVCLSVVEYINKLWSIYSVEFYTAVRMNGLQVYATKG